MPPPETPRLTTDVVLRLVEDERPHRLVLIERAAEPYGLALPGGFVEVGERVESAARREACEEVGLEPVLDGLLGVYSDPARDPRGHNVSITWVGHATGRPRAATDAASVHLFSEEALPFDRLVFDHATILRDYLAARDRFPFSKES